jgi:hypothetical protein
MSMAIPGWAAAGLVVAAALLSILILRTFFGKPRK